MEMCSGGAVVNDFSKPTVVNHAKWSTIRSDQFDAGIRDGFSGYVRAYTSAAVHFVREFCLLHFVACP